MATQNEEFKFPDEQEEENVEIKVEENENKTSKQEDENIDPTDEELSQYGQRVQRRMKRFSEGYHEEKRARESAEQERLAAEELARAVLDENKRLKEQLKTGSQVYIETSKSAAEIKLESAEKKLKEAFEAGDGEKLAEAQKEIARATIELDRASSMKPIEVQENFKIPERQQVQQQISPRTQRWVKENSDWFGPDDEMTSLAMGLDKKLQREYGANYIGTEEYFRTIDTVMRKRFPEYFETQSNEDDDRTSQTRSNPAAAEPQSRARQASPVSPASRSTSPNRIKLSPAQISIARKLGVTPEEYAKQVAILNRGER